MSTFGGMSVIESIDITKFGCYQNFVWKTSVVGDDGKQKYFKKLNVIYGRNYSGKTTFSRLIRALETKRISSKIDSPSFSVNCTNQTIASSGLAQSLLNVRVYNKDFVDENLSFLKSDEGEIKPFAILGSINAEIAKQIKEIESELGSVEEKSGSRYQYFLKKNSIADIGKKVASKKSVIDDAFTEKANAKPDGIKHNPLFKDPNYDSKKLRLDIKTIDASNFVVLSEEELANDVLILKDVALPKINTHATLTSILPSLLNDVNNLLIRKISPTEPLQDLLNDAALQAWVKDGVKLHKHRRTDCGFCGNQIPADLWDKLNKHFDEQSEKMQQEIALLRSKIGRAKSESEKFVNIDENAFYSQYRNDVSKLKTSLQSEIDNYHTTLDLLANALSQREVDIFTTISIVPPLDNVTYINQLVKLINESVQLNNSKLHSLEQDQKSARERVRLTNIKHFIEKLGLNEKQTEIRGLEDELKSLNEELSELEQEGKRKAKAIKELNAQQNDEKKGAEQVNKYLNQYFGHNSIRLEAFTPIHRT